jgi:hypothetical protein
MVTCGQKYETIFAPVASQIVVAEQGRSKIVVSEQ